MTHGANLSRRGTALGDPELKHPMLDILDIDSHSLTYGDGFSGSHRLRRIVAQFVSRQFNSFAPVDKQHVSITSGVGPAIELCAFSLCDAVDAALLARPYYGSFPGDLGLRAGVSVIGVSFGTVDAFATEALDAYEQALLGAQDRGVKVRALILCNPHNPLGRCYSKETLKSYMRFCQKHGLHLISDEIYALSIWENPKAPGAPRLTSVLSIDTKHLVDPGLVHVLWGMSKDFCANGIRLGCVISQNNTSFLRALETNSYFTCPSALSDCLTWAILSDRPFVESFVAKNRTRMAESFAIASGFLNDHKIPTRRIATPDSSSGQTFLGAAARSSSVPSRRTAVGARGHAAARLPGESSLLGAGKAFGSDLPGWFRIVFTHEGSYLGEALGRIARVLEAFPKDITTVCDRGLE